MGSLMIYPAQEFEFDPPAPISRARRILIKPLAWSSRPYPWTTDPRLIEKVICGIRRVSEADIILIEGEPTGKPMGAIYKSLDYGSLKAHLLDVKDSLWLEIENTLPRPFIFPAISVPNILLSCDYWISIVPLRVINNIGQFSIYNLLGLLPVERYPRKKLYEMGLENVLADIYFTIPFDLGIVDGSKKLVAPDELSEGEVEGFGKIFVGEPFEVDEEAAKEVGCSAPYLELIRLAKAGVATPD